MKGTEKIIAHIQADAKAQADAILAQAEQQCAEIKSEYEAKAREAYSERIREGVKSCEENLKNRGRLAEMENRKEILALKQELMASSFEKAKAFMLSLPDDAYSDLLVLLAVRGADNGEGEVVLNASDREKYGVSVVENANARIGNGKLTLSGTVGDFEGGLIVRNGLVESNNTVGLMVEMSREELSAEVAGLLFD